MLGVVAAFTLGAGIDDAIANADRVGTSWDASIYPVGDASSLTPEQSAAVTDDPDISDQAEAQNVITRIAGAPTPAFSLEPVRGTLSYRLLDGRAPEEEDEAVLGPDTLAELDLDIGDTVPAGGEGEIELRIIGTALLQQGVHWAYDQGAWLTPDGLRAVAATTPDKQVFEAAVLVLVLALPTALVAANVLAAIPGRSAAHVRPAHVLRSE